MPYGFQQVVICAFDFHLMLAPLTGGIQPNAPFDYLVDPNLYNQQYSAGTKTQTAHLSFAPLNWRSLTYHHFWKHYQTLQTDATTGKYDFWKLQMPLSGKLKDQVKLVTGVPTITGTVRPTIFLSGIGWSTNVTISLTGQMTQAELSNFVGSLSNKGAAVFEINGKRMTLPELFEVIGNFVLTEVYQPKSIDTLRLKRHLIVCPFAATGPVGHYPADPMQKRISTADRASLHSILLGAPVSFNEILNLERDKKFLVTQFYQGPDFALTYFDKGTLIFMQQTAIGGGPYRGALQSQLDCLLNNIRNYLLITFGLYHFCLATDRNPTLNQKAKTLRGDLIFTVKAIPNSYSNQFCQSFHQNFTALAKLK